MTVCARCGGNGFLQYETHRNGKFFVQISKCCNEYKYAKEVKRRHAPVKPEDNTPKVLDFNRKKRT